MHHPYFGPTQKEFLLSDDEVYYFSTLSSQEEKDAFIDIHFSDLNRPYELIRIIESLDDNKLKDLLIKYAINKCEVFKTDEMFCFLLEAYEFGNLNTDKYFYMFEHIKNSKMSIGDIVNTSDYLWGLLSDNIINEEMISKLSKCYNWDLSYMSL